MAHRTDFPFPRRVIPIDRSGIDAFMPAPDDDIEEFPLLLKPSEVQELIQAARQEGLTAAGLRVRSFATICPGCGTILEKGRAAGCDCHNRGTSAESAGI
jgi:hypothetical protein